MDFIRRDLLDTLNDVLSEDVLASMAAEEQQHSAVRQGHKVRVSPCTQRQDTLLWASGRCEVTAYCSKQCAKASWAEHKVVCETYGETRKGAFAAHEARGGRKKDYNQMTRDTLDWFVRSLA
jgi:tRNA nucleotidyltransferase/poly(A) polymerase